MNFYLENNQLIFTVVIGCALICLVYSLARKGLISFRYVVGWLLLGVLIVASGPIAFLIHPISSALAITRGTLLSMMGLMLVVAICIQLSISISGIHERLRRASEEISHLKNTIEKMNNK